MTGTAQEFDPPPSAGPHVSTRPEPSFAGTPPFPEAARTALADDQLRANLGRATATIRTKRAAVVAERADWEELRLAGAAIKDAVLHDLAALLGQLEEAVTAAGGIVHWARDAASVGSDISNFMLPVTLTALAPSARNRAACCSDCAPMPDRQASMARVNAPLLA